MATIVGIPSDSNLINDQTSRQIQSVSADTQSMIDNALNSLNSHVSRQDDNDNSRKEQNSDDSDQDEQFNDVLESFISITEETKTDINQIEQDSDVAATDKETMLFNERLYPEYLVLKDTLKRRIGNPKRLRDDDFQHHENLSKKINQSHAQGNIIVTDNHVREESYLRSELMVAVEEGVLDKVQDLVQHGAYLNEQSIEEGLTALMVAAEYNNFDILKYLTLQGKANVFLRNKAHDTAMTLAASKNQSEMVRFFIEETAITANMTGKYTMTSLMYASAFGDLQMVKYLIERAHADPEARTVHGLNAIMFAALRGHFTIVIYLAEKTGVELTQKSIYGDTLHSIAVIKGYYDIAEFIREKTGFIRHIYDFISAFLIKYLGSRRNLNIKQLN